ncbi:MAG: hypothetical protein AAF617_02920 [Bacteroidota bacterium]
MKNTIFTFIVCLILTSCAEPKNEKEVYLDNFKADLEMLLDSSIQYLDKGIKLLKQDVDPAEISALIGAKLEDFRKTINAKSKEFSQNAPKMKIRVEEYDNIFIELNKITQQIKEKHFYLVENGVKIK